MAVVSVEKEKRLYIITVIEVNEIPCDAVLFCENKTRRHWLNMYIVSSGCNFYFPVVS